MEEDSIQQKDDRREVPIFCAVCIGEFEASERVCWSSNTECTHVFHHDCMLHWLKSVGKRACKLQQSFSETPSVKQVMNFDICNVHVVVNRSINNCTAFCIRPSRAECKKGSARIFVAFLCRNSRKIANAYTATCVGIQYGGPPCILACTG